MNYYLLPSGEGGASATDEGLQSVSIPSYVG